MHISTVCGGYDCGNGSTKLVLDGLEYRAPAFCHVLNKAAREVSEVSDGAYVEYVDGSRADLHGQTWLTGSAAWYAAPSTIQKVVHDRQGKIKFGLHLLLGAVAALQYQPSWNLSLTASIHDAEAFGSRLSEALEGQHKIRLHDGRVSLVTVKILGVREEGVGALFEGAAKKILNTGKQNILLDFGHGTTIASVFAPGGRIMEHLPHTGGVDALMVSLASHLETRRFLSQPGDPELFRQGIESRTFTYGSTGWNFSKVYAEELKAWVREHLAIALHSVDRWADASDVRLAVGGGAQLPAIGEVLAAKGIKTLENSTMANARGLYRVSSIKLATAGGVK